MSIYKAALLVLRSHVEGPVATQIAVAAALAIVGVKAGAIASRGISAEQFKRVVAAALVAVACLMMWQGQSETRESEPERTGEQQPRNTSPNLAPEPGPQSSMRKSK